MQITGGFLRSRKIIAPKTANVRPTLSQVRESVYSTLYSMIDFDGKTFLDAFAGSGIMGFEKSMQGGEPSHPIRPVPCCPSRPEAMSF